MAHGHSWHDSVAVHKSVEEQRRVEGTPGSRQARRLVKIQIRICFAAWYSEKKKIYTILKGDSFISVYRLKIKSVLV